jgi:hypothetical protein
MRKIKVKVIPSSKKELVTEMANGVIKAKVNSPAEKGRANQRVKELLAEKYEVKKGNIKITKGQSSEIKQIIIS